MRFFNHLIFGFLAVLILSAPVVYGDDYQTGPGDVLNITVYDNEDLSVSVRVAANGTIVMPLLGKIDVKGMTVDAITQEITRLLADGFLVNPQVNIYVEDYRSKRVVVLGNVRNPGIIELNGPITFLELISKAGGLEKDAGDTATIQREKGKDSLLVVDLRALIEKGDISQNIMINDGDSVFVSKADMCYITGEVEAPGTYPCGEGTSVLKLVALAKGFTGKAAKSGVDIIRIVAEKKTVLEDVSLDTPLRRNDVVVVPESFF